MSAMREALHRAGFNQREAEFMVALAKFTNGGGTFERARELVAEAERQSGGAKVIPPQGQAVHAPARHPNGGEAGQFCDAREGHDVAARPSPHARNGEGQSARADEARPSAPSAVAPDREQGANHVAPKGHRGPAPAREPDMADRRAAAAAHRMAAASILDTFTITERQGSRTAIGDIRIDACDRILTALRKRTWVSSREYHTVYLIKSEAERHAHVPDGARVRDIIGTAAAERIVKMASEMAYPPTPYAERPDAA